MSVIELDAAYCAARLPKRDPSGHKFTFGVLTCLAGSLDYAGAALMTGLAAVRGGAGMVCLAVPSSIQSVFAGRVPETITLGLTETTDGQIDPDPSFAAIAAREPAALVIGPGLQESAGYAGLILRLIRDSGVPAVIDAAALSMAADAGAWSPASASAAASASATAGSSAAVGARSRCVLTPHGGEFARLTGEPVGPGDEERLERALSAARGLGQVVVLKGPRTVIGDSDGRAVISPFENAALATAGTGDVLAGLIGALLCQGATPFDAAAVGVYLHGRAAERLSSRYGDAGLLATEIAHEIPAARHELAQHSQ